MSIAIHARLIGLALLFAAPAAAAESLAKPSAESNVETARACFQRGVDFFHEGNFEAALAEFRKANQIAPSYRILYNIAQAYYETHDYVSALKYYKQYLTDGDADVTESRKTAVAETIQKLEARIAYLEIAVNVDGAQVSVDDVPVGISPLAGPISVNPGPRRVSASKTGLPVATRTISAAGSDRLNVALVLRAQPDLRPGAQAAPGQEIAVSAEGGPTSQSRAPLIVALTATGACAVATGVFAWLTVRAKDDFDRDLNSFKVSGSQLNDDRSRLRTFALVTDIVAAATIASGGLSLYFAFTRSSSSSQSAKQQRFVALTPMPGGVTLSGGW
jgi:tetratricopeptide (TPR) repeat protein